MMAAVFEQEWLERLPLPRRALLERVAELQTEIAEAAAGGDWVRTSELERQRAGKLHQLYRNLDSLSGEEGEALAEVTRRLIEEDRALVDRVARERDRLGVELGSLRRGQRAVDAYTRHAEG